MVLWGIFFPIYRNNFYQNLKVAAPLCSPSDFLQCASPTSGRAARSLGPGARLSRRPLVFLLIFLDPVYSFWEGVVNSTASKGRPAEAPGKKGGEGGERLLKEAEATQMQLQGVHHRSTSYRLWDLGRVNLAARLSSL